MQQPGHEMLCLLLWGTPHKPCPHDAAGFERHESSDNARFLIGAGVPTSHLLEETASLETVGNAYFTRTLHTDVLGLQVVCSMCFKTFGSPA